MRLTEQDVIQELTNYSLFVLVRLAGQVVIQELTNYSLFVPVRLTGCINPVTRQLLCLFACLFVSEGGSECSFVSLFEYLS